MKHILIIGGSKGIGSAIIDDLIETHRITNISRTAQEQSHHNLTHYSLNVLEDELPEIESIDGLVYCPGSINLKPINRLGIEDFKNDFEINVLGAVKCIKHYLKALKNGTNPSIILFSTVAAKLGMPFHASVAAAKSAVEGLVKSLGAEFAPSIRINAIAPTVTDTSLAEKILRNDSMKEKMVERHPLKKYLNPKDVANMATFLLSERSNSISGQVFELDCGIVSFKI